MERYAFWEKCQKRCVLVGHAARVIVNVNYECALEKRGEPSLDLEERNLSLRGRRTEDFLDISKYLLRVGVCVSSMELQRKKNFRKRSAEEEAEGEGGPHVESDDEQERRYRVSFPFIR